MDAAFHLHIVIMKRVKGLTVMIINSLYQKHIVPLLTILLLLLIASGSFAGQFGGETAANFLKIGLGAQSAGMGGAYTAVAEGAVSSFWNPANMARSERGDLILGHQSWLQDIALEYGSISFGLHDDWSGNAAIVYMGYGDIPGYDLLGNSTGQISAYDLMASVSGSFRVKEDFSAGLTLKLVHQKLDQVSASTVAGDLGIQYSSGIWRAGLVLANVGGSMTFESVPEKLPSEVRLGVSVKPFASDVLLATDMTKQFHGGAKFANGVQVGFEEQYFVRGGWEYKQNGFESDWQSTFNAGLGMRFNEYAIDYSYTIENSLTEEDHHRFSLGYHFR